MTEISNCGKKVNVDFRLPVSRISVYQIFNLSFWIKSHVSAKAYKLRNSVDVKDAGQLPNLTCYV